MANFNDASFFSKNLLNCFRPHMFSGATGDMSQDGESEPESPADTFHFCKLFFFLVKTLKSMLVKVCRVLFLVVVY